VLWCTPRCRAIVPRRQPSIVARRRISAARPGGITTTPPASAPTAQEVVPDHRPAAVAADRADKACGGSRGSAGGCRKTRWSLACRHADRAPCRRATLMRHFLQLQGPPPTVGNLARGMTVPAPGRSLIALPSLTNAASPHRTAALGTAVALAPVAPRAQVHRLAAQVAQETPTIRTQGQTPRAWTPTPKPAMMDSLGAPAPGSRGGRGLAKHSPSSACLLAPILSRKTLSTYPQIPRGRLPRSRATMMLTLLSGFVRPTARIPRVSTAAHNPGPSRRVGWLGAARRPVGFRVALLRETHGAVGP